MQNNKQQKQNALQQERTKKFYELSWQLFEKKGVITKTSDKFAKK